MGTSTEVTPKLCAHERVEVKRFVNDARLWHPWLRINRVLRVMLHTRWSGRRGRRSGSSSGGRSRFGV